MMLNTIHHTKCEDGLALLPDGRPGQIGFQLLHFRRYVIQAPPQSRALLGIVVGVLWIRIDLLFITIKIG